jgi:hypothetical protein
VIKGDWQKFPDTAPHDRPILIRGKWKPFDNFEGGGIEVQIARWGTLMSNGVNGYKWFIGLAGLDHYNVDWAEWLDIPE